MPQKLKFRSNDRREEAQADEFIPFACHYDPTTLLTKNGELLQTIKITGFTFESVNSGSESISLRRTLRKTILENINSSSYAVWFHTVRRKKDLTTGGEYPAGSFSEYLNKKWCKKHDWEHKYVNELYVTIIREGQNFELNFGSFFRSLSSTAEIKYREKYIDASFKELNDIVEKVLVGLKDFGARRLSMVQKDGITYSEPLQFFGKILNLKETPMPAPIMDASEYLPTHKTFFGFNALEVVGQTGRHFGAILSIKEYHEVTSTAIDEFLQLDQQFIITETFDFINNQLVQKKYEHQKYILSLSGDKIYGKVSGLDEIINSNRNMLTDFGEHQITIMLVEDDMLMLEEETDRIMKSFHELGIVAIREDVMLEDCYWSQLPGNFVFLRRLSPINTSRIAGFASLYNFPAGKISGNHWGNAVTVFYTKSNTPYFFNFHEGINGHTTIIGPYGSGKTVLMNFLVSEAVKYNPRIVFFDHHRGSELFLRALGGKYSRLLKDVRSNKVRLNPFRLSDKPENRQFLKLWLYYLLMDENSQISEADRNKLEAAVDYVFSLPEGQRKLSSVAAKFWPISTEELVSQSEKLMKEIEEKNKANININALLSEVNKSKDNSENKETGDKILFLNSAEARLANWYGEGKLAHIFDNVDDGLDLNADYLGFDLTEIVQEKWPVPAVISYLLHRVRQLLDGRPTIIVLDEAWRLVDNQAVAPRLGDFLDYASQRNAIVIFATESVSEASSSNITKALMQKIATQIYLPNPEADNVYKNVFSLSEKEFEMLKSMYKEERQFLLKHHGDAVVAKLNLSGMNDVISVLSGNRENIAFLESIILEVGDNPKDWLPKFLERFSR